MGIRFQVAPGLWLGRAVDLVMVLSIRFPS
jgi:hypothetical protein